jgi:hypothetical protein
MKAFQVTKGHGLNIPTWKYNLPFGGSGGGVGGGGDGNRSPDGVSLSGFLIHCDLGSHWISCVYQRQGMEDHYFLSL